MASPSLVLLNSSELVKQGAEAKVYKAWPHPAPDGSDEAPEPMLLKHRFKKTYRHPILNATLTKSRIAGEARILMKCMKVGVRVPELRMVDAAEGILGIEWIEGRSIRSILGGDHEADLPPEESSEYQSAAESPESDDAAVILEEFGTTKSELMSMIGSELAIMHNADIIHGDLTTSNMMLRRRQNEESSATVVELVLIDFGLSFISSMVEDKAVDLYVLERAFSSTHPDSGSLFALILEAYGKKTGKAWKAVSRKLDEGMDAIYLDKEVLRN